MGATFEFTCPRCGYAAQVAGGLDSGFIALVRSMVCLDCKEAVDVLIGRMGEEGPTGDEKFDKDLGICPTCRGRNLTAWPDTRPCPRCDAPMNRSHDPVILWD